MTVLFQSSARMIVIAMVNVVVTGNVLVSPDLRGKPVIQLSAVQTIAQAQIEVFAFQQVNASVSQVSGNINEVIALIY